MAFTGIASSSHGGIVRDALGIAIASGAYALSFGAIATTAGLSLLQTAALSTLMFLARRSSRWLGCLEPVAACGPALRRPRCSARAMRCTG